MARLYANENFPLDCVLELRRLGHDVLTVQESGRGGVSWPDVEVLQFATNEKRAVITFNRRHFINLHTQSTDHAGILVCSMDTDFAALAGRIDVAVSSTPELTGTLIRINRE